MVVLTFLFPDSCFLLPSDEVFHFKPYRLYLMPHPPLATVESMKDINSKITAVQAEIRSKEKGNASKLQTWSQLLSEANAHFDQAIVEYEISHIQVKTQHSLYITIIEAKIEKNGEQPESQFPFVEILVDTSTRGRSRTLWAEEDLVWNQSFDIVVPIASTELAFKLWTEGKDGTASTALGKSEIMLSSLPMQKMITEWYSFFARGFGHVPDQSCINCMVKYRTGTPSGQATITVIVLEAKNLVEDGADLPSPYCKISLLDQGGKDQDKKDKKDKAQKSSVVKKNDNPHWEEGFMFKFNWDEAKTTKLLIEVHDDRQSKVSFMGQSIIPLSSIIPNPDKDSENISWQRLRRRAKIDDPTSVVLPQVGQIKLDLLYREEHLLPDAFYDPIFELLHDEHKFLINFCYKTASGPAQKKDILKSIVATFEVKNRSTWLLKTLSDAEVDDTWDISVLFRGNSIASSCLDIFMRTVGRQILDATFRPILRELYKSTKSCELDPVRSNTKSFDAKKNLAYFVECMNIIWEAILATCDKIPATMRTVLAHLRYRVAGKWPNEANAKYTAVTSFLFLRFFCPALMAPHSFDLVDELPSPLVSRNLALLSKAIMNLASFIKYGSKEPCLSPINDWLSANFGKMRDYIDRLVDDPDSFDVTSTQASLALFSYGREMNLIREFLNSRMDKITLEVEVSKETADQLVQLQQQAVLAPGSSNSDSRHAHKEHNSDDEEDIVEDLTNGGAKKGSRRREFRRVSSKSRLADGASRKSIVLNNSKGTNEAVLRLYGVTLEKTAAALKNFEHSLIAAKESIPTPSLVGKDSFSSTSSSESSSRGNGLPSQAEAPGPLSRVKATEATRTKRSGSGSMIRTPYR